MTIRDDVKFLMPRSCEYQIAAMAAVQSFVNGFEARCKETDVSGGTAQYELHYELHMRDEDFAFFTRCGLELVTQPEKLERVDMSVDMRESRTDRFRASGRHLVQVCGLQCGVDARPLPVMQRSKVKAGNWVWKLRPKLEEILAYEDAEVTGVIAIRGAETYLAAARGLAVVELIAPTEHPNWLTKWQNKLYRLIVTDAPDDRIAVMIARAQRSVEAYIQSRWQKKEAA